MQPEPVRRLLALYQRATRKTRKEGAHWYERAHELCLEACGWGPFFAQEPGAPAPLNSAQACGIVAAYSPRTPWHRNLLLAERTWRTGQPGGHTRPTCALVQRILDGECPVTVLRGPKVNAFYRALMGDTTAPVVDSHMFRAMGLDPSARREYPRAAEYLITAARLAVEPVAQFQATVWIIQRGAAW